MNLSKYLSLITSLVLICWMNSGQAQNVGVNILYPDSSAIFHLESDSLGFLPPTMTTAQRDSIQDPATGLVIYNTQDSTLQYFNGKCWLRTFQEDCNECFFDFSLDEQTGNINRVTSDTTGTDVYLSQNSNTSYTIGLFLMHNLPQGITAKLDTYTVQGADTLHLTVEASIFADPGTYPIAIQAVCNSKIENRIFTVTVDSCYEVQVLSNQTNYDMQSANNLPGPGTPICAVLDVMPGTRITSNDTTQPSLDIGNLDDSSHVGINNQGAVIAKGGDGGTGGSLSNFGNPGFGGGDAINMTTKTTLKNNGYIFGGGGGGGSVGLGIGNIPIVGNLSLGAGGGGGAANGEGGKQGQINLPYFDAGDDATGGINGQPGDGGEVTSAISFSLQGASITLTPNIIGGDGGGYGQDGGTGNAFVNVQVSVPIVGTIFNQDFPDPPISSFPPGGKGGNAVKRNNFPLFGGYPDGFYQTSYIKGDIGP